MQRIDYLTLTVTLSAALKHDEWTGNPALFLLACCLADVEDLAADLWRDAFGSDLGSPRFETRTATLYGGLRFDMDVTRLAAMRGKVPTFVAA